MDDELTKLWADFSLSEAEGGEFEVQREEVQCVVQRGRSRVVGRLEADMNVCKETIKITLLCWWKLKGSFSLKILGDNLFLIEFEYEEDKNRVLKGQPWVFKGSLLLQEDFDGRTYSNIQYMF